MNLHQPNANEALQTRNRSRDVAPQSGICSRCLDGCKGNCDMFQATFRGRELLYPQPFGRVTAGADKDYPVDYSHLNIMGYALGAKGVDPDPDKATFPTVDTETEFGVTDKVKMKVPIFTGALGSTDIARKNWNHFAIGAAISHFNASQDVISDRVNADTVTVFSGGPAHAADIFEQLRAASLEDE